MIPARPQVLPPGVRCRDLVVDGRPGWVLEPSEPRPGRPWVWKAEFPDCWPELDAALLAEGVHIAHLVVGNTFGCPVALDLWDRFRVLLQAEGLTSRPALVAHSRGGLYAYGWAARHPEDVAAIFADNPVCDFRSWPGGQGAGPGSPWDWSLLLACYGFPDAAAALAYDRQPLDVLPVLAARRLPLLHRVGSADALVPVAENTDLLAARYRALGGSIEVIVTPGAGHHPHGLPDPSPVVAFLLRHLDPGHPPCVSIRASAFSS